MAAILAGRAACRAGGASGCKAPWFSRIVACATGEPRAATAKQARHDGRGRFYNTRLSILSFPGLAMIRRYPAALLLASTLLCAGAHAQTLHPLKLSKAELAGPVFQRPGVVKESKDGNHTSDFTSYTSPDKVFQTGVYQSGPVREEIREAPGTPYTEFLYFLSGSVKLTSSDGTVMQVHAGEAVTLPKGWTGVYESSGYTKLYALYDPSAAAPAKPEQ